MAKGNRYTATSINSVVRFLRLYRGLSQKELALASGLSVLDVGNMERGKLDIQIVKAFRLKEYFGIRVNTILRNSFVEAIASLAAFNVKETANKKVKEALRRRQERADRIGQLGEDFVAQRERQLLAGTPYAAGVNPRYADDLNAGFDTLSFTLDGKQRFIEVKSTAGNCEDGFYMSAREIEFLKFCRQNQYLYELHRVYQIGSPGGPKVRIYTADELGEFCFTPDTYFVTKEKSK